MEIILNNAKLADWMRNFYIEIPKTTPRKLFQWMESDSSQIIPFWMFPDIKDSEGEEYFDEYDTSRHRKPVPLPIVMHKGDAIFSTFIFLFLFLCIIYYTQLMLMNHLGGF